MSNATCSQRVREAAAWQLKSLGANVATDLRETMLIREGLYCGRKFHCERFEVVWFIEENELKFFGPDGSVLLCIAATDCLAEFEQHYSTDNDRRAA